MFEFNGNDNLTRSVLTLIFLCKNNVEHLIQETVKWKLNRTVPIYFNCILKFIICFIQRFIKYKLIVLIVKLFIDLF